MSDADRNVILAALPAPERDRVLQTSERVALNQDDLLSAAGERIRHVHFPDPGCIVLLTAGADEANMGIGLIGKEGMLGTSLLLGADASPLRAQLLLTGHALRVDAEVFRRLLVDAPVLEYLLRVYLHTLMTQCAQTAACTAFHVIAARLANWLLAIHDRANADRYYLTHELLARVLGVQRSGVSVAAGILQRHKLISYTRGHIVIRDRKGLERAACSCYRSASAMLRPVDAGVAAARGAAVPRPSRPPPLIERRHHPRLGAASRKAAPLPVA